MDSNRNTLEKFSDIESQLSGLELRKGAILEEYLRGHTSSGHKVSEDIAKAMRFL